MQKRKLGSQGLEVSALGLGCMGMSWAYGQSDDGESLRVLGRSLELGLTFWDTADMYGSGANEKLLAQALRHSRQEVTLATKCGITGLVEGELQVNGRPEYIRQCCEQSLARLQTDVIDLYYLHRIDPQVPIEETMGAMGELVQEGKVRFLGLSEAAPDTIRRAHSEAPLSALQSEYSLWTRDLEESTFPVLRELGIGLVPYSPLGRGFLSGKITSLEDLDEGDFRRTQPRFKEDALTHNLRVVETVKAVAVQHGVTAAEIALAWILHQGKDIVPIPGTKRMSYLEQNARAGNLKLSEDQLSALQDVSGRTQGSRYSEGLMKAVSL